ncbi:uncharacterized protein BXZ73DRAFT_95435 [Epithele typhae]|uniref:uncharacterized protein n=1 Tax=Epithele typhae TaxID=378194 RepID=UPI0020079029|nr:uncharacterized protein BXZ73DRAFT_95435 [Epithele typhae]KAH9945914.1 hypothetical protein BXZ73DRAFT_95435 [Epithele typhae]
MNQQARRPKARWKRPEALLTPRHGSHHKPPRVSAVHGGNTYRRFLLDPSLLRLSTDEVIFYKAQTGIQADDALFDHIHSVAADAYQLFPYPCVRWYTFTQCVFMFSPPPRSCQGATNSNLFLDIGAGFGNDLRKLVHDGYPVDRMIAFDIRPEFWELGHRLFNSSPTSSLSHPSGLEPVPIPRALTSLVPLAGHASVVYASYLFHLFNEADQARLARILARLLRRTPGATIFGRHKGLASAGLDDAFTSERPMYCHSPESWQDLWRGVFGEDVPVEISAVLSGPSTGSPEAGAAAVDETESPLPALQAVGRGSGHRGGRIIWSGAYGYSEHSIVPFCACSDWLLTLEFGASVWGHDPVRSYALHNVRLRVPEAHPSHSHLMAIPSTSADEFSKSAYDYVVVGGGTTGLVVAARLSEDPDVSVAVIEAGGWDPEVPGVNIPGMVGSTLFNPKHDYAFFTVPQTNSNGRKVYQPRSREGPWGLIGGASFVNYELFENAAFLHVFWWQINFLGMNRSSAHEYDAIEALGNPGWNWEEFLKYMVKSETTFPLDSQAYPTHFNALHTAITTTFEKVGVPLNSEPNSGDLLGSSMQFTSVDPVSATRSYSATAYYVPNASRKNLHVLINSTVSKIVFESGSVPLVANGVEVLNDGRKFNDHISACIIDEIDPSIDTIDPTLSQEPEEIKKVQALYAEKKGFLSSACADIFAYAPASTFVPPEQVKAWDDQMNMLLKTASPGLKKQLEIQRKWFHDPKSGEMAPGKRYSSMSGIILHPTSRGSVHIASTDPTASPAIDTNYFGNPQDLETLLAIVKFGLKVRATAPWADVIRAPVAPSAEQRASDEGLVQYIKDNCGPVYHPVGTAAMLPREDGGVVDPALRVYGTANVRVVDASILPMEITAHSQATVYAIGKRWGADLIKKDM